MPDNANTLYELDLLLSDVSLAERKAGLSRADIATAQARTDRQIIAALNRIGGYATLTNILAVRMIVLRSRLETARSHRG